MKTQFSRRRNALLGNRSILGPLSLGVLSLLLIFFLMRVFLPGLLATLATPLWKTGTVLTAGAGNTTSFFSDRIKLIQERDRLLAEQAALTQQALVSRARIQDLERLLGDRTEPNEGILAGVLARPPVTPYDILIVDAGTSSGVSVGDRVFGAGGTPIGTVASVAGETARIMLYSAAGQETESWIGVDRIAVTLVGRGSGAFSALVAREAGINPGDQVFVPGPGALPVGSVRAVASDPSSPRSLLEIEPLVNPFSITWVTIAP